jgi:hypothetical protein
VDASDGQPQEANEATASTLLELIKSSNDLSTKFTSLLLLLLQWTPKQKSCLTFSSPRASKDRWLFKT